MDGKIGKPLQNESPENLSKGMADSNGKLEKLQQQLQKKHAAEAKALDVVVALLESAVNRASLVEAAGYINVDYYTDVTTERAISRTCGYPLCDNQLTNVPKQKYRISLRHKKVYDLTELKNFCSDGCFRASKYFEAQLSTAPVWVLTDERPTSGSRRPALIDDAEIPGETGSLSSQKSGAVRACDIAQGVADSATVVVDARQIAARLDELTLHTDVAAVSVQPRCATASDDLTPRNAAAAMQGEVSAKGHVRGLVSDTLPAAASEGHAWTQLSASSAAMAPADSDVEAPLSSSITGSTSLHSSQLSPVATRAPSSAGYGPVQVALSRLLEWHTPYTGAWLSLAVYGEHDMGTHSVAEAVGASKDCSFAGPQAATAGTTSVLPSAKPLVAGSYAQCAIQFLMTGDSKVQMAKAADNAAQDADERVEWGPLPVSEAEGQVVIRRKIVAEKLGKSIVLAEAMLGPDICAALRGRGLLRLAGTFRLTKDNVTLKPAEWISIILLLSYLAARDDAAALQKIHAALRGYGCTANEFLLLHEHFNLDHALNVGDLHN